MQDALLFFPWTKNKAVTKLQLPACRAVWSSVFAREWEVRVGKEGTDPPALGPHRASVRQSGCPCLQGPWVLLGARLSDWPFFQWPLLPPNLVPDCKCFGLSCSKCSVINWEIMEKHWFHSLSCRLCAGTGHNLQTPFPALCVCSPLTDSSPSCPADVGLHLSWGQEQSWFPGEGRTPSRCPSSVGTLAEALTSLQQVPMGEGANGTSSGSLVWAAGEVKNHSWYWNGQSVGRRYAGGRGTSNCPTASAVVSPPHLPNSHPLSQHLC